MNRISGKLHADSLLSVDAISFLSRSLSQRCSHFWHCRCGLRRTPGLILAGANPIPAYGYVAMAGGVRISLVVGGGLMALVFYSSRHGYDDPKWAEDETDRW